MDFSQIIAFTDGACTGNPGPGGWGVVFVTPTGEVQELGGAMRETTNNRMEMIAVCKLLERLHQDKRELTIYTDSAYVIKGINEWIHGWRRRGWKNSVGDDVLNRDLWEWMSELVSCRSAKVNWKYVKGHSGVPGNERVDEIAVAFAKHTPIDLYRGPLLGYSVPVLDLPPDVPVPDMTQKAREKQKAYSYLSVVDGVARRHGTWAECEQLVKGRSGAKFKRAMSAEDEINILKSWGINHKL